MRALKSITIVVMMMPLREYFPAIWKHAIGITCDIICVCVCAAQTMLIILNIIISDKVMCSKFSKT